MPVHRPGRFAFRPVVAAGSLLLAGLAAGCSGLPETEPEMQVSEARSKAAQALRMADTVRQAGDLSTAMLFFKRAQTLDPDSPEPLIGLAQTASQLGVRDEAIEAYGKALALRPATAETRLDYAKLLVSIDRPELAAAQFAEVIKLTPDDHRAFNGLGAALDLTGRHEEAQQAYTDGLLLAPNNPGLRNNLALSRALSGDFAEAARLLKELTKDPQIGPKARENLALVHALAGDWDAAAQAIDGLLPPAQQQAKLDTYRSATRLSGRDLAAVVFGVREAPKGLAAVTAPDTVANPPAAPSPTPLSVAAASEPMLSIGSDGRVEEANAAPVSQTPVKRRRAPSPQPDAAMLAAVAAADPVPGSVGQVVSPRFVLPSGLTATADPVPGAIGRLRAPDTIPPQTAADPVPGAVGRERSGPPEVASPAATLPPPVKSPQNPETPATAAALLANRTVPPATAPTTPLAKTSVAASETVPALPSGYPRATH